MFLFIFCLKGHHLFHCSGSQHRTNCALPSALKSRAETTWLNILVSVKHFLSDLWFGLESQVEWALPLSLKRLLAVLWHMDNPTRNQSLHSYWGNRWANMFPGGCPYYSGASGTPGDSRARWNWGVVTTEWTGNELLQDKWAATWEMRNPPTKSRDKRWMAASTNTLLPQLHSCIDVICCL